jgi:hypothetical protein
MSDLAGTTEPWPRDDPRDDPRGDSREDPREDPRDDGLWSAGRRALTIGLILNVTIVASEALAVSTIMPIVARDLGGIDLYGWVFSGFFLGSLLGIVVAGMLIDRGSLARPFVLGIGLFAIGLLVGGLAPSMAILVGARVIQGLGAGAIPAVAYVSIGRALPERLRPRMFATLSTAWVLPGVIGPTLAGVVAESLRRSALVALVALVAVAVVVVGPATALPDDAAEIGTFGYSFDRITERGIAGRIDRVAPRGSSVLAYEVQDRYFLRDDLRVISLDGLTDAAVAPYRGTNLVGFLRQVRPDYWIANKAVEYRPFLAHTVLHEAYERLIADASLRQVTIDGIEFRVVARRTTPFPVHSSGWWTLLVRLRYQGAP